MPPLPTPSQTPPAAAAPGPPRSPAPSSRSVRAAALAVLAAIVVLVLVLSGSGAGQQPPATGAAAVVPADALAYVNASIDRHRPAVKRALALASRFPGYAPLLATVRSRLGGVAGGSGSLDFAQDIQPWLGDEAALALLNTPSSTAGSLIVLAVRDRARAQAFLNTAGAQRSGSYRGSQLWRYASGTVLAFIGHFLVLGQDASVHAALDVNAGAVPSLQSASTYRKAVAGAPDDRVLDAYASVAGVRRLLAPQGGVIGAFGALLYQPALSGVTLTVSPSSDGARVRIHTALDLRLAALGPRPTSFTPTLERQIPSGSMLMLDLTGLDKVAPHVLNAGAAGGLAGRVGPLLSRLGAALASEGVNVADLVSLFHGETVLAITPSTAARAVAAAQRPALTIVARTRDETRTRTELAALELPLEQLFPPPRSGAGQAPVFNERQQGGVTIHQLSLAPGLEFDYAVSHGLVILSTSLGAAAQVAAHRHALVDDPAFKRALPSSPEQVSSLLFLDFSQLLNLAEQTGLTRSATYRALRADLLKVRSVGLSSTSGEADSTAELFFQIP